MRHVHRLDCLRNHWTERSVAKSLGWLCNLWYFIREVSIGERSFDNLVDRKAWQVCTSFSTVFKIPERYVSIVFLHCFAKKDSSRSWKYTWNQDQDRSGQIRTEWTMYRNSRRVFLLRKEILPFHFSFEEFVGPEMWSIIFPFCSWYQRESEEWELVRRKLLFHQREKERKERRGNK